MHNEKFRPQHNKPILSLWCYKLSRKSEAPIQEWIGRIQIKAGECKNQENDRRLKEQFINGMNDEAITAKIIKGLMAIRDTSEVSSGQVIVWALRVGAPRPQKAVLDHIRDTKEFDSIVNNRQIPSQNRQWKEGVKETKKRENCR